MLPSQEPSTLAFLTLRLAAALGERAARPSRGGAICSQNILVFARQDETKSGRNKLMLAGDLGNGSEPCVWQELLQRFQLRVLCRWHPMDLQHRRPSLLFLQARRQLPRSPASRFGSAAGVGTAVRVVAGVWDWEHLLPAP